MFNVRLTTGAGASGESSKHGRILKVTRDRGVRRIIIFSLRGARPRTHSGERVASFSMFNLGLLLNIGMTVKLRAYPGHLLQTASIKSAGHDLSLSLSCIALCRKATAP